MKINRIIAAQYFTGPRCALPEATLIARLEAVNIGQLTPPQVNGLRELARRIIQADPFPLMPLHHWPGAFVLDQGRDGSVASWVVALCITFQRAARDWVGQGEVLLEKPGQLVLALPWSRRDIAAVALKLSIEAMNDVLQGTTTSADSVGRRWDKWLSQAQKGGLSPNSWRFARSARERNIPVTIQVGMLRLGWGAKRMRMDSSFTDNTSNIATRIARNKLQTKRLLTDAFVPVPKGVLAREYDHLVQAVETLGWPLVIKPNNQDQGLGVVANISNRQLLDDSYREAIRISPEGVIVEQFVPGDDHRMLVVGGKLLMATRRIPGGVRGDGARSIRHLVEAVNQDPRRGDGKRNLMIALSLDPEALGYLAEQCLSPDSVPAKGQFVALRRTANISTGGTAEDVTSLVHPDNRMVVERAARVVGLDIAGVDLLCPDISRSWKEVGGAVCEVNAQPGFRPHWLSDGGRDINGEIIDWLFAGDNGRIPTTAITGTNGKSTVALMLHRIWLAAGVNAGVCTTQGTWVGAAQIDSTNLSGKPGADLMMSDPGIEAAVIEVPRLGLLKFGHPCDYYDVATVLNIQDDHIGVDGVRSRQEMAGLKSEVLRRATKAIVINGDDPLCMAAARKATAPRRIVVTAGESSDTLLKTLAKDDEAVCVLSVDGQRWIVQIRGGVEYPVMPLSAIPGTMMGLIGFNESNALFAVALGLAHGLDISAIRSGLAEFDNTAQYNPGRFNFIEGFPFTVLLDYAHNPEGVLGLCDVVNKLDVKGKRRLVVFILGNRSKTHIDTCVAHLANCFDEFVIGGESGRISRCKDYEGEDSFGIMLDYFHDRMVEAGVNPDHIFTERNVQRGIAEAINRSGSGDLLVLMTEFSDAMAVLNSTPVV